MKGETSNQAEYVCPACGGEQYTNGLIAWCEAGHVYNVGRDDPRWSPA